MYEAKRLRYLEIVKRENASNSSNMKVQGQGVEGTTSSTASLTSASERPEETCALQKRTGSEQNRRRLETDRSLKQAGNNPLEVVGRVIHAQDNGSGNGCNGQNQPEEQVTMLGDPQMNVARNKNASRPMFKQATTQHRVACENMEYAGRLREQMMGDSVAALRRISKDVYHSVPEPIGGSLPISPPAVIMEDRIGSESGSTGVAYTAGDPERKGFNSSKAKYAQQLRKQIVANEKARRASAIPVDSEKKKSAAAASAIPGTNWDGGVVDRTVRAREEYALKLREQIASKIADKNAEGQKDYVNPTANDGLAWLESATEERQRQRRILKAEYAEQLRAQIAERAGQRRLKFDSQALDEEIAGGLRLGDGVAHGDHEVRPSHIPSNESPAFGR